MSAPSDSNVETTGAPPVEFTNEVRYAVVMYGGVSLCIYINGVAQELLELARATAASPGAQHALTSTDELGASAKVYRRLAQYLDSDASESAVLRHDSDAPLRTRFVVDVLSGTSAGGLNSIFLAKALANNGDMKGLTKLWMEEGDIAKLLNDRKSNSSGYPAQRKPASLLNSRRMYEKLLTALHEMDFPGEDDEAQPADPAPTGSDAASPLVQELDLYVTATDLRGLPVHLKLDNTVADELRHRNVFRFRYGTGFSEFTWEFNPILAYCGRCTSSIPPAFEPMRLDDIDDVLPRWPRYRHMARDGAPDWSRFYPDYRNTGETGDFRKRDFGDGGFLDNKPFSYATRALMRRQAAIPVSRKLLYIEPSVEHLQCDTASDPGKPDAFETSMAALIGLPRYETIREDLEAVLDRNRLLERVDEVSQKVEQDVELLGQRVIQREVSGAKFARTPLTEFIKEHGSAYGIYHRLKVAEVTSDLAALLSELLQFPDGTDECLAVRELVERWRDLRYVELPHHSPQREPAQLTQSRFLLEFDPTYRLRRLFFIHRKITFFYRFAPGSPRAREREKAIAKGDPDPLPRDIAKIFANPERWKRFRQALLEMKAALADVLHRLRVAGHELRSDQELTRAIAELKLDRNELRRALREPDLAAALVTSPQRQEAIDRVANRIRELYALAFRAASGASEAALAPRESHSPEEHAARTALWKIYEHFDHYDMAIFPLQYGTGSAEAPYVDIVRVSPGDAKNLCHDKGSRRKLAGTEFFNFGAFFADFWRENDMLWGRLDGAEILVRNLLAKTPAHHALAEHDPAFRDHPSLKPGRSRTVVDLVVDDLHTAILRDHLTGPQRAAIWKMVQRALPHLNRDNLHEEVDRFLDDTPQLDHAMRHLISFCKEDCELLRYYKESYAVDRRLDRGQLLKVMARASRIFGRMLEDVSDRHGKKGSAPTALVMRVASIFSGLVELSFPRSGWQILAFYWRPLLYVIGLLLFGGGLLFGNEAVQNGGLIIVAVTFAVHLTTFALETWIIRGAWFKQAPLYGVIALLLALLGLGTWKAVELLHVAQEKKEVALSLVRHWAGNIRQTQAPPTQL